MALIRKAELVTLGELAALTGLSKSYVIRSFRRVVGMPPYEWLPQQRIEEARKYLKSGSAIGDLAVLTPASYAAGHYRSRQTGVLPAASELRQRPMRQALST